MENDAKLKYNQQGVLKIVGTPIGNLMDLSPRGIEAFQKTDFIVCEDTRVTKRLAKLRNFSIKKLTSLNDFNETKKLDSIVNSKYVIVPLFYDEIVRFISKNITGMELNAINTLDLKRVKKK